jgi:hypothetical protein
LNVHEVSDVLQTEIHTAEPLVPEPSFSEVEISVEKLEKYKLPGIDHIPAELIQFGGNTLCSEIHKLINCIWNNKELAEQWKESIVPVYKKGDKNMYINYRGISLLSDAYKVLSNIRRSRLTPYEYEITGIISVDFDVIDHYWFDVLLL